MELGVQSYCLRGTRENPAVAEAVKECGVRRVEVCAVHADFSEPQAFASVVDDYSGSGVTVVSIGVNRIGGDRDAVRALFESARVARIDRMSVDFPIHELDAAIEITEALTEEFGISVGIHNHGGKHWLGSSAALEWVFSRTSPRIGLSLDTAWAIDSNEDPLEMIRRFADRLQLVHIKDFVFEPDRSPRDVIVGTGNLVLSDLDASLVQAGFQGEAILEYEGDVDDPIPALAKCVAAVGSQMSLVTIPANG